MSDSGNPCKATCTSGKPCKANAGASGYCYHHDPARSIERTAARMRGGKARHGRVLGKTSETTGDNAYQIETVTADSLMEVLKVAINDCLKLERSLNRSRTLASIVGAAFDAIKVTEFEQRLAALEESQTASNSTRNQFRGVNNGYRAAH